MSNWNEIILTRAEQRPPVGETLILRYRESDATAHIRYDVGIFRLEGRKLWWHGQTRIIAAAKLREYGSNTHWCRMPEFDGYEDHRDT